MNNQPLLPYQLQVDVTINWSMPENFKSETLQASIQEQTQLLIDELGLPANAQSQIIFSKLDGDQNQLIICIEGEICRQPVFLDLDRDDAVTLASQIMTIIVENRCLLISQGVAELIQRLHILSGSNQFRQLDLTGYRQLLKTMVQRGFSISRMPDFKTNDNTDDWDYLTFYEAIIASTDLPTIQISYSDAYQKLADQAKEGKRLVDLNSLLQDGLFYELGAVFPLIDWNQRSEFEDNAFQIKLNDITYPLVHGLAPNSILANDTVERLQSLYHIEGRKDINPANGNECTIVDTGFENQLPEMELTTWNAVEYMILYLSVMLKRQAGSYLTKSIVENHIDNLRKHSRNLVNVFLKRYDPSLLTRILRDLQDDEISIRDLRSIMDYLLLANGSYKSNLSDEYIVFYSEGVYLIYINGIYQDELHFSDYAEYIRANFKRYISHKYTRGRATLSVYLIDAALEKKIQGMKGKEVSESDKEVRQQIVKCIYDEIGPSGVSGEKQFILTTIETRRMLQDLIRIELPNVVALNYQELSPDMNIQPIARITLGD